MHFAGRMLSAIALVDPDLPAISGLPPEWFSDWSGRP
jgi:hypothetical protein